MTNRIKMNRFITVVTVALVVALGVSHLSAQSGYDLFQKALAKERADGNLTEAIQLYQRVVKQFASDRALVAKALVQMAECYQKLGDVQAKQIYERVLREYADQKEPAILARARLGRTAAVASVKGDRAVWTGPNVDPYGRVSPDGRFITHRDSDGGNLMIHDIAANVDRVLTPPELAFNWSKVVHESRISRDGKHVAYVWYADNVVGTALRVATLQERGFLEPRQVFLTDYGFIGSFDWSPDGKWIAAAIPLKDRTYQIALIAVADGSSRMLKSMDGEPKSIFFSPDNKYIAYDLPARDPSQQRDVFVLAIDGSREYPAVVHSANESVMGWSPDGTRLLFSSDRMGSVALWALTFADGKAQRSPELLKSDIGPSVSLGLTVSGAMYVHKRISTRDIAIASIDLAAGKLLGPPVSFNQGFVRGASNPVWSPDGRYLSYYACGNGAGDASCLVTRSVATGQVRRLPRTVTSPTGSNWSPDGRSLIVRGNLSGREGIFQIDAQSGEATAVLLSDGLVGRPIWSPDGTKLYFNRGNPAAGGGIVERDLASGAERKIGGGFPNTLSPDGQYFISFDRPTRASLLLQPVGGGQPREVLRLTPPEAVVGAQWTHDSSALIVTKDIGSRLELWLVSVAGGPPRKLDIDPSIWLEGSSGADGEFRVSPDGRSIAFVMGTTVSEVWALENFLPAGNAKR